METAENHRSEFMTFKMNIMLLTPPAGLVGVLRGSTFVVIYSFRSVLTLRAAPDDNSVFYTSCKLWSDVSRPLRLKGTSDQGAKYPVRTVVIFRVVTTIIAPD